MSSENKGLGGLVIGAIGFVLMFAIMMGGIILVTSGPVGIQNRWTSWKASAFGSDWYVVHYLPDGSINEYYLKDSAIHNEEASDGIYFNIPENGKNVTIHLSTFHEHVQSPTPSVIKGLRGNRQVGFSNVPPEFMNPTSLPAPTPQPVDVQT